MEPSTTRRPATRRPPRIPYPELPPTPMTGGTRREIFWRAAWLRDAAEHQALKGLIERKSFGNEPAPLKSAIYDAIGTSSLAAQRSLQQLVEAGGLLYAWLPEGGAA